PLVRGTYNFIDFDKGKDSVGKEVEFGDIHNFEIEGALKLEYQFNGERELPTTGYIKPSVIQMLASGGEVTVDGKEYKDTLDNETIGRIEVGLDAELVKNFSLGVFGNYSFGSDYDAWGVGGNVRIIW
ncbi:MAG: autotransporter outer membrane beta-barrel domain-containing protein, partial [Alphaproteobacteria bacterium]|nr:autotransporter outer membrane beta-barrel domain-containing protein [Alphaproteobacteria bacterium]